MGKRYSRSAVQGGGGNFPEGTYRGTIAEISETQNDEGTWGSIAFQLVNNAAVEAEREPGARPHFVRVTVYGTTQDKKGRDQKVLVADVDPDDEAIDFGLRKAVSQWLQLAQQLGRATALPDGGVEMDGELEAFIEEFKDGAFEGEEVEFQVTHSISKKERALAASEHRQPRPFVNTTFVASEAAEPVEADADETTDDEEEVEETEEVEEEVPEEEEAPAPRRGASRRAPAKPPAAAPRGSGKAKFTRKGRR